MHGVRCRRAPRDTSACTLTPQKCVLTSASIIENAPPWPLSPTGPLSPPSRQWHGVGNQRIRLHQSQGKKQYDKQEPRRKSCCPSQRYRELQRGWQHGTVTARPGERCVIDHQWLSWRDWFDRHSPNVPARLSKFCLCSNEDGVTENKQQTRWQKCLTPLQQRYQ